MRPETAAVRPQLDHFQPGLTGIRGIAMAAIFLYHTRLPLFSSVFLSVDLFFLLSGFLITLLLYREYNLTSRILLKNFYLRRLLRLLPALFFMLGCHLLAVALLFPPELLVRQGGDILIVLGKVANWSRAFAFERPDLLAHTWSLSTEEQFYLLWPLSMLFLLRMKPRSQIILTTALLVIITVWRPLLLQTEVPWERLYNDFTCRADMLLYGCLAAMLHEHGVWAKFYNTPAWIQTLLRGAMVVLMAALLSTADWQSRWVYQYGYPLVGLAGAFLCVDTFNRPDSLTARFLAVRPFVQLGMISYAFYLFHYPIIEILYRLGIKTAPVCLLSFVITLLLSLISWRYVETPALRIKKRFASDQ